MTQNLENRPWGCFQTLYDGSDCKVKRITVLPGHRISYQYHNRRKEHWFVISGNGWITLDDSSSTVQEGSIIDIPVGSRHTIGCKEGESSLVFVEVQTGDYFGEDDIVRLNDDYGRT